MKTNRQVRPDCERNSSIIQPPNEAYQNALPLIRACAACDLPSEFPTSATPLIRACATCERELGIQHAAGERVTHGFCRRHAIGWLRETGLPVVKIEAAIARLGECCPDLGQVRARLNQAFFGPALAGKGGAR